MLNSIKDRKSQKDKAEQEKRIKKALAEKCAGLGGEYSSHQEDETQYTVITLNGKTIKVRKEEIVLESPDNI